MMTFEQLMNWVENEHVFPPNIADYHNRRFLKLLKEGQKYQPLAQLPVVTAVGSCGKASVLCFTAKILASLGLKVIVGSKPPVEESCRGNCQRYQLWENAEARWISPGEFAQEALPLHELVNSDCCRDLTSIAPYDLRYWILASWALDCHADVLCSEANIGRLHDPVAQFPCQVATLLTRLGTDHGQLLVAPADFYPQLGAYAGPIYHKTTGLPQSNAVVAGMQEEAISDVLSPNWLRYGVDYQVGEWESSVAGSQFTLRVSERLAEYCQIPQATLASLSFSLDSLGDFQIYNACQAFVAALVLRRRAQLAKAQQLATDDPLHSIVSSNLCRRLAAVSDQEFFNASIRGLKQTSIPGRMQLINRNPVEIATVSSSPEKLKALLQALDAVLPQDAQVSVCASFLDRIHYLKEAVEILASYPRLKRFLVVKVLDNEANRDVEPSHVLPWCASAQACASLKSAREELRHSVADNEILLYLGNGVVSQLV